MSSRKFLPASGCYAVSVQTLPRLGIEEVQRLGIEAQRDLVAQRELEPRGEPRRQLVAPGARAHQQLLPERLDQVEAQPHAGSGRRLPAGRRTQVLGTDAEDNRPTLARRQRAPPAGRELEREGAPFGPEAQRASPV